MTTDQATNVEDFRRTLDELVDGPRRIFEQAAVPPTVWRRLARRFRRYVGAS